MNDRPEIKRHKQPYKEPAHTDDSVGNGGSTPDQYALPEGATQIQDLIEYRNMNFSIGNVFKAAYRLGTKSGVTPEYDLNKIIFFAKRELERMKRCS